MTEGKKEIQFKIGPEIIEAQKLLQWSNEYIRFNWGKNMTRMEWLRFLDFLRFLEQKILLECPTESSPSPDWLKSLNILINRSDEQRVANQLSVSLTTIQRWVRRQSEPHHIIKKIIIKDASES